MYFLALIGAALATAIVVWIFQWLIVVRHSPYAPEFFRNSWLDGFVMLCVAVALTGAMALVVLAARASGLDEFTAVLLAALAPAAAAFAGDHLFQLEGPVAPRGGGEATPLP